MTIRSFLPLEIPATMQKLMFKGLTQDTKTLRELKVTPNAKMMLVGSTVNDIIDVVKPVVMTPKDLASQPCKSCMSC